MTQHGSRYNTDRRRMLLVAAVCTALALILTAGAVALARLESSAATQPPNRAAIVDQLAITDPNPAFVSAATKELEAAGYRVDYYPPEAITVDFYRSLPARGYRFVILRSHTSDFRAPIGGTTADAPQASTGLFTNEVYTRHAHVADQVGRRLMVDAYADRDIASKYFGITPEFLLQSSRGRFPDATVVVLMGCSGLKTNDLAQAFLQKGAAQFVSWDEPVTAEHTDAATQALLTNLFAAGNRDLREAVASTMRTVGPDPSFGARLAVYP